MAYLIWDKSQNWLSTLLYILLGNILFNNPCCHQLFFSAVLVNSCIFLQWKIAWECFSTAAASESTVRKWGPIRRWPLSAAVKRSPAEISCRCFPKHAVFSLWLVHSSPLSFVVVQRCVCMCKMYHGEREEKYLKWKKFVISVFTLDNSGRKTPDVI